ncbi:MAG: MFS transporter [Cellvibrionaceae bacterium]
MSTSAIQVSPWAPFKSKIFSALWLSGMISTIGVRMHEVGAGWLMTSLSTDPLMVALVQTATTLPIFLFALPAGAIADVVSKRKLLIIVQIIMAIVAGLLTYVVYKGTITPGLLLLFIFALGTGAAFVAPAKQAIVPQLIPKEELQSAIALNSVGFNLSRAIGPAIAGILITTVGIAAPFAFNAVSFLLIIAALLMWCPFRVIGDLPKERIPGAIMTGLRYVRYSPPLKATFRKAFAFFISASAFWALLPLLVKTELEGDAKLFGLLIGMIGIGAVIGAILLPRVKQTFSPERLVTVSSIALVGVFLVAATFQIKELIMFVCIIFGACWVWVLSTFNVSAQLALPDWVRARGLAIYLMVFFGSMSLGSVVWGLVASEFDICNAIFIAACTLGLGTFMTRKYELNQGKALDLSPSTHWPEPIVADVNDENELLNERSPVLVTIEYQVDKADVKAFLSLMYQMGRVRKQYGAYTWNILEESDKPGHFIEQFMDVSWLEHLRHHQRVTGKDEELQKKIRALHRGEELPKVRHFLGHEPV